VAISKVERLMNLVIALLSTRQFLTAERIRDSVAGYEDSASDEAFSRMFERDKNELRDLGIPLEVGQVSRFSTVEGYRINRDAYELPDIDLTSEEAAAVAVANDTWAALQVAARPENTGKIIVSIICDFGERYLSNPVYTELPDPDFSDIEDALAPPAGVP